MKKLHKSHAFRLRLLVAATMAATSIGSPVHAAAPESGVQEERRPVVIAHRGGAMARPENTMPAFEHAADLGVEYLEFDMVMTADDRVVVYHDATINPDFCTPEEGSAVTPAAVRDLTFAQTQEFDCGTGVRPIYAGERFVPVPGARIPELSEVLRAFRDSDALFFAETKIPRDADIDPVLFATLLEQAVRENGLEDRLILQSFDFRTVDALHQINPRIRTCLLGVPRQTREYLRMLRQQNATCIVLSHEEVDAAEVRALQDAGILVFSGVADDESSWEKYIDLGVDALFTNDPEAAIDFLRQTGVRD